MKNKSFRSRVLQSLLFYNILFVIVTVIFCSTIPKLFVYPPNSINTEFERHIDDGFRYDNQCAVVIFIAMIASNALFMFELRKIKGWEKYVNRDVLDEKERERLRKIKINCYKIPSKLYLLHAFVPPIVAALGLILTRNEDDINN